MATIDVLINRLNKQSKLLIAAMDMNERGYSTILEAFNPEWIRERLRLIEDAMYKVRVELEQLESNNEL